MAKRPPLITPEPITGQVDATHPGPTGGTPQGPPPVPADIGQTFRSYTTALGQALPDGINRARATSAGFHNLVR